MSYSDGLLQHDEVFGEFIREFPCHAKAHHDIRANQLPAPIPLFYLLVNVASTEHSVDCAIPVSSGDNNICTVLVTIGQTHADSLVVLYEYLCYCSFVGYLAA